MKRLQIEDCRLKIAQELAIADCRLPICGSGIVQETTIHAISQSLGKIAVSVSKLWKPELLNLFSAVNRHAACGMRQFFVRFPSVNRQSLTFNLQFFVRFATANLQSSIFNRKFR